MSFTSSFREEILQVATLESNAEKFAFVAAVLRIVGNIHINNKGINIEVEGDKTLILKFVQELKCLYKDIDIELVQGVRHNNIDNSFIAKLPASYTERIADDTGFVTYVDGVPIGFSKGVAIDLATDAERKAYFFGVVASCVSITVPQKTADESIYNGGYHLEMVFTCETLAYDVMDYFATVDIFMKKIQRGDSYGLYIKDSDMISDFMAFFGANMSVIEINNIMVARSLRNDVNRKTNCLLANIDKTVEAGQKQCQAIEIIEEKMGLDKLPIGLQEIAKLRLAHPDYTLDNIVTELGSVSKSGANHRLRKLIEIANKLTAEEGNNG